MSGLAALMIGWGVFWLLIWVLAFIVFMLPPRKADSVEKAFGTAVLGLLACFWIVSWTVVRSLAA